MPFQPFRTRIKFCGMTRPGDVRLAGELGVDAVGFVFAARSRRRVEPAQALAMREALAPMVDAVALFMDNPAEEVRQVVTTMRPSLLQFHGDEDEGFCRSFGLPYLKAVPMGADASPDPLELHARYPTAAGFLLDAHAPGEPGGGGRAFDWAKVPRGLTKPILVAGGLTPDNVHDAIVATRPWGVDVASGVELQGGAPGIKDGARMRRFVEEVRRADCG
ncbi:phosphoribosylanthranilate isomerase [Luteimonas sp. J16]|jgi:phosphoribosylanthranilate isomerase|uniref:phosphoribosylanthranilate isomerase n=1 Tax=unclassified Luteimonas TaxID=2629088 RepID=UPI00047C83F9|nr:MULTISPECIES: phosphoribosylanthranilate isomerase [unclassified Luteimonas]TWG88777.1 phosphoribosylanthranilate isomerase [Luteimonas sp. J16]